MKQLTLKLPEESHRAIKMIAAATGKTMTELIIEWIEDHKDLVLPVGQRILKNSIRKE